MIEVDNEQLREAVCELGAQLSARVAALDVSEAELRRVGLELDGVMAQVHMYMRARERGGGVVCV